MHGRRHKEKASFVAQQEHHRNLQPLTFGWVFHHGCFHLLSSFSDQLLKVGCSDSTQIFLDFPLIAPD